MQAFIARQFAKSKAIPNTFIGGIAKTGGAGINAPIDTPYKLSQKLGIAVNRITGFKVIGDDVECRIRGNYSLSDWGATSQANANQNITSFIDEDSLVTTQGSIYGFRNCKNLQFIKLNGIDTAFSLFRQCTHPDLEVEMLNLKNTTNAFFSQLNDNFNQNKLVGFPSLEDLGTIAFHNVNGFTELDLPTVTRIRTQAFYGVRNCVNYYLNNVTNANADIPFIIGNGACKLIEMKKCKSVGSRLFNNEANAVPHPTDFTMRLNIAIKTSAAVVHTKTHYPWAVIEFYDDAGNYVETI